MFNRSNVGFASGLRSRRSPSDLTPRATQNAVAFSTASPPIASSGVRANDRVPSKPAWPRTNPKNERAPIDHDCTRHPTPWTVRLVQITPRVRNILVLNFYAQHAGSIRRGIWIHSLRGWDRPSHLRELSSSSLPPRESQGHAVGNVTNDQSVNSSAPQPGELGEALLDRENCHVDLRGVAAHLYRGLVLPTAHHNPMILAVCAMVGGQHVTATDPQPRCSPQLTVPGVANQHRTISREHRLFHPVSPQAAFPRRVTLARRTPPPHQLGTPMVLRYSRRTSSVPVSPSPSGLLALRSYQGETRFLEVLLFQA